MSLSVAVAGASGYAGGEVLRLLAAHPEFDIRTVTAFANAGQSLGAVHPHLRSLTQLELVETTPQNLTGHDVVFLALPHGKSGAVTEALDPAALVIDGGADHRLTSESDWARFSGKKCDRKSRRSFAWHMQDVEIIWEFLNDLDILHMPSISIPQSDWARFREAKSIP